MQSASTRAGVRWRRAEAAWTCALFASALGCVQVNARPPEPSAKQIREVHLDGNRHVDERAILAGLETRAPHGYFRRVYSWLDEYAVEQDRARIETYYYAQGHFSARVTGVEITEPSSDRADVRFTVDEGEPSMLASVDIRGAPNQPGLDIETLQSLSGLTVGERFQYAIYVRAKRRLSRRLAERGYAFAEVVGRVLVYPHEHRVVIELDIKPGPLARFGSTKVIGLRDVPESVVLARLAWEPGDVFDPETLEVTRARLHALGMFSTVRIDFVQDKPTERIEMQVLVAETPKREIRFGVGFGVDQTSWEIRGRAGYSILGLFDPLTRLSLEATPAYTEGRGLGTDDGPEAEASATLRREDLIFPRLSATASVSYALEELETHTANGPSVRVGLDRPLASERIRLGFGWRYRRLMLTSVDIDENSEIAAVLGIDDDTYHLGLFEQRIAYDGRDRPINPRLGYYTELRLEQGGAFAGGEFTYGLASVELRGFVPLGDRLTLGTRIRGSTVLWGDLPITQRLFGGGATGHRGFDQRGLSPIETTTSGDVGIGGEALVEASIEARLDVIRLGGQWFAVAAFVDAGDVSRLPSELTLTNPYMAAGGGLRYRTVVGALRFDVGYRIHRFGGDSDPNECDRVALHLTLGEAF